MRTKVDETALPTALLDRVTLILTCFSGPNGLTPAQIIRRTGLPRSSVHRTLDHLVKLRWLQRQERNYTLGLRLIELGSLAAQYDHLQPIALPHMLRLQRTTGLVIHLAVLDGSDVVYRERLGGRFGEMVPTSVGERRPAFRTALGKSLLAFEGYPGAQYDTIREQGIAWEREEAVPGIGCIAVPVGPTGSTLAAVSVSGPVNQMTFDVPLGSQVRMTAAAIWRGLSKQVAPVMQHRISQS